MNYWITKEAFESLPFRDDWKGSYVPNGRYRARAYPNTVFIKRDWGVGFDAYPADIEGAVNEQPSKLGAGTLAG